MVDLHGGEGNMTKHNTDYLGSVVKLNSSMAMKILLQCNLLEEE